MGTQAATLDRRPLPARPHTANEDYFVRQGILKLLAVKDSDIRILNLEQCRDAVDKGIHAGGALSATMLIFIYSQSDTNGRQAAEDLESILLKAGS